MKCFTFRMTAVCLVAVCLVAVATMAGLGALTAAARGHGDAEAAPVFVTEIPQGYREWTWISSAHEAGKLNSLGAVIGERCGDQGL